MSTEQNIYQPLIDIIAPHLAKQSAQAMSDLGDDFGDGSCHYRIERNGKVLMCAVGALLDGHVDVTELEGLPASDLLQPDTEGLTASLADVHDKATARLRSLVPTASLDHLGIVLDDFQNYHDATENMFNDTRTRYADVLKMQLTEEQREAHIRADLQRRLNYLTTHRRVRQSPSPQ